MRGKLTKKRHTVLACYVLPHKVPDCGCPFALPPRIQRVRVRERISRAPQLEGGKGARKEE